MTTITCGAPRGVRWPASAVHRWRRAVPAAALALACVALSGCGGIGKFLTTPQADDTIGARVLDHIEACKRHYQGALGAGVTGSFDITCEPQIVPLKDATAADLSPP